MCRVCNEDPAWWLSCASADKSSRRRRCSERLPTPSRQPCRGLCSTRAIPWIEFTKGQDKDKLVETYRQQFTADEGVVLVGVAQEKAKAWAATKKIDGRRVHFTFNWRTVYVNHYYIYLIDRDWGPAFIKVCGYAPWAVKVCLNAHEWAKRQAQRRGIPCEALDNGFLACADPAALQAICDSLSADDIQDFFDRWVGSLPLPLTSDDAASGFAYRLSSGWRSASPRCSMTQCVDASSLRR
jgi:hypothetical protein